MEYPRLARDVCRRSEFDGGHDQCLKRPKGYVLISSIPRDGQATEESQPRLDSLSQFLIECETKVLVSLVLFASLAMHQND